MNKPQKSFSKLIVYSILFLLLVKIFFSYLDVELGWWLRHLTPNFIKYNFLHLPKSFSHIIEFGILPLLLLYLLLNIKKIGTLIIPIALSVVLLFLNLLTAHFNDVSIINSIKLTIKIVSPVYLFIVLIIHSRNSYDDIKRIAILFILFCGFLAVFALLFFDVSFNRGYQRLPIYFSGLHTHSYVLASIFIGICFLLKDKGIKLYAFIFVSLLFLVIGWNVRTVILFYGIVALSLVFQKNIYVRYIFAKTVPIIPILFVALLVFVSTLDLDSLSSGRISMYEKKMRMLDDYTLGDYLIGRGKGADLVTTREWWYAKKGSHNDFLTYSIENGLLYLFVFILLILSLLLVKKKIPVLFLVAILGYFLTSAISNGFSVRPLASYVLFIILAMIIIETPKTQLKE